MKKRWILWLAGALVLGSVHLPAQEAGSVSQELERLWEEWLEGHSEEEMESLYEDLADLLEHPIDLNQAGEQELARLPFLDERQKAALAGFLDRHRPLAGVSDLLLIEGWDEWTVRALRPFIVVETSRDNDRKGPGYGPFRQRLRIKTDGSLQRKKGYLDSDSLRRLSKAYLGSPLAASLVWQGQYSRHWQGGLATEKDAGEKGIDYLSGYLQYKEGGRLKNLVLGDYHVSMGRGLVCHAGTYGGKAAAAAALMGQGSGLRPHRSTAETGSLRGGGLQLDLGRHGSLMAFYSRQRIDTRKQDSLFTSLKKDGLHRTLNEQACRANTGLIQSGGQLSYRQSWAQWSVNALYYLFDTTWQPDSQPYRRYQFRGRQGGNLSLDGRLRYRQLLLGGELACDARGSLSGLASLSWQAHPLLHCLLSYRHYGTGYQAPFAAAFGENSSAANEEGMFAWIDCRLLKNWALTAYLDCYRFPWLKYQVNAPSKGSELMVEGRYAADRRTECLLRFKEKIGPRQLPADECLPGVAPLQARRRRQARLQLSLTNEGWRYRATADIHWQKILQEAAGRQGCVVSQELRLNPDRQPWVLSLQHSLFDTGGLSLSSYQPDLAGGLPFASVSGQGQRTVLLLGLRPSPCWQVDLRLRHTRYSDRSSVGSGLESIDGCRQTQMGAVFVLKL